VGLGERVVDLGYFYAVFEVWEVITERGCGGVEKSKGGEEESRTPERRLPDLHRGLFRGEGEGWS